MNDMQSDCQAIIRMKAQNLADEIDGYILFDLLTTGWNIVKTSSSINIDDWCQENIGDGLVLSGKSSEWKTITNEVWLIINVFGDSTIAVKNKCDVIKLQEELEKRKVWGILSK